MEDGETLTLFNYVLPYFGEWSAVEVVTHHVGVLLVAEVLAHASDVLVIQA